MDSKSKDAALAEAERKERLAAALRENLKRRKAQARGRRTDAGAATPTPTARED